MTDRGQESDPCTVLGFVTGMRFAHPNQLGLEPGFPRHRSHAGSRLRAPDGVESIEQVVA